MIVRDCLVGLACFLVGVGILVKLLHGWGLRDAERNARHREDPAEKEEAWWDHAVP